jgi:hypothetical protein
MRDQRSRWGFDERMTVLGPHVFDGFRSHALPSGGWTATDCSPGAGVLPGERSARLSRDVRSDRCSHRMPAELGEVPEGWRGAGALILLYGLRSTDVLALRSDQVIQREHDGFGPARLCVPERWLPAGADDDRTNATGT